MTYQSHHAAPSRFFDHLYDPLFTTSGHRDVDRNHQRALAHSAPIDTFPVFHTMFTDLPWRPRNFFVPRRNTLPHLAAFSASRSTVTSEGVPPPAYDITASGQDRAKFFAAPLVNKHTIALRLQLDAECRCVPQPPTPLTPPKNAGCQTDYRVQSAQTRPWQPPPKHEHPPTCAFDRPRTPELWRVGEDQRDEPHELPGLYHAELVLRARKRRAFELGLPPLESEADGQRRRMVLEAFEWEAWLARERHIEYLQRLRLGIVRRLMAERAERKQRRCEAQVELTAERVAREARQQLEKLRNAYRRKQRRLDVWHKGVSLKWRPVDIITEHIDRASTLYLPYKRFGEHPNQRHFRLHPTTFVPSWQRRRNEAAAAEEREAKERAVHRTTTNEELQALYHKLRALRSKTHEPTQPDCLRANDHSLSQIFATPMDTNAEQLDDHRHQNAVFLQKLMRGRAVQKELYTGRNKFRFLVAEFRSSHQLNDIVQLNQMQYRVNFTTAARLKTHRRQMQLAALLKAESQIFEVIGQAVSTTILFALDLLESEMIRVVDQKMAHALCLLAETERYRREAIEAGRRQMSENRRRFHDEVVRSDTTTRQNTICHYLETALVECMDKMSERRARAQIRKVVKLIDQGADEPSAAHLAEGILEQDIMPAVMRRIAHENYLADVHRSFFGDLVPDRLNQRRRQTQRLGDALAEERQEIRRQSELEQQAASAGPTEAMSCIERVLANVMELTTDPDKERSASILDKIVASIPASALCEGRTAAESARSAQNQERLQEIVQEVRDAVWSGPDEEAAVGGSAEDTVRERSAVRVSFREDDEVKDDHEVESLSE